jgi:hypothetical protein
MQRVQVKFPILGEVRQVGSNPWEAFSALCTAYTGMCFQAITRTTHAQTRNLNLCWRWRRADSKSRILGTWAEAPSLERATSTLAVQSPGLDTWAQLPG